jgi:hypothetical protein
MGNPVWKVFVAEQMEIWLDFFRNNHVESYIDMVEKFIRLHPYYIPDENDLGTDTGNLVKRLLWNENFATKLSDKGLMVWMASPVSDFIEELGVYRHEYSEINRLAGMFSRHSLWFERVYTHMRKVILTDRGLQ